MGECIAVYGGSFDPPHLGHTLACTYVLTGWPVDRVIVVPVGSHAFSKPLSGFEHRYRMCELAFAPLKHVEISRLEQTLPAPNFTLTTLEALAKQHPGASLRLVIGSDLLGETAGWHEFERVRALAPPIVIPRAGYESDQAPGPALPNISSSEVRARLRAGASTDGLLDARVAQYALEHRLY